MKIGKQSWRFSNDVYLTSTGTTSGPLEAKGPLGTNFDKTYANLHCGEKNWEAAERKLMRDAIDICLKNVNKKPEDIDFFMAGDLLNQVVTSNIIASEHQIPHLGMFGACSTSMQTLALASQFVDSGFADSVVTAVSSHNATAERQFRYPTEYGGPKPKTATFTVTGAGASMVSREPSKIKITEATIGRVMDWGINDANDMGSAMAPAAADTIETHLADTGRQPEDYDMIATGDLSSVGSPILRELLWERGIDINGVHQDCGLMLFSPDQPVFAGGSGAACSAIVTYSYIANQLREGKLRRVLIVATGALHNPTIIYQKQSIPCIAHGVVLESTVGGE
ncbi:stage V sporulation protein AD [Pullulanibacillus pueri]|uniref:Stage V sporulation protein AD n=1 Tax=Pullulanibacillus pueri TaxID=1437324 RepID=A0A8J2ZUT0_9BACL|nr:stage V sporulation protein AD [Pullulanibacillus pueri]MBM7681519.1 stage V sporulation protein AD [Pullulanibacillus pueri]GGH79204.1 stage V sporulation protein AD [Pullulanibacillus pueri]